MRVKSKPGFHAWVDIVRIFNIPIPLAGILVGACAADACFPSMWPMLTIAAVLGCAATQCFNDFEDRVVDHSNAPFRPIPSGRLEAQQVLVVGHLLMLAWALVSCLHSTKAAAIVGLAYLLTRWYSRAKQHTLFHHLMLPAALGLMPIYGSLMVDDAVHVLAWFSGVSIFLIDINMNIVGAFKDLWAGSAKERVLPLVWGARPAVAVALLAGLVGLAVQIIPVALGLCAAPPLIPLSLAAMLTIDSRARLLKSPNASVGYAALKSGRLTECLSFPALIAGVLPLRDALLTIGALTFFALLAQSSIPEAQLPPEADTTLT